MNMTSCSSLGEQGSEHNDIISLLSLELSLIKDLLGCSQNLIELALKREPDALAGILERRGDLIHEIRRVEGEIQAVRRPDCHLKSEGYRVLGEGEIVHEMLKERQDAIRSLESVDERLMAILSEWKEDVAAGLISLERGRASALAYGAPVHAGASPVFLDSRK